MLANGSGESCGEQALKNFKLPTLNNDESPEVVSEVAEKLNNVNKIEHATRNEGYDYKFFCSLVDGPSWDEEFVEAQKRIRFSNYLQEMADKRRRDQLMRGTKKAAHPPFNPQEVANKLNSLVDRSIDY